MSKYKSPAAYADVKKVMDLALKVPGLQYELTSPGKALRFRQRCNMYRNLLRDMEREMLEMVPGARAESAYDILVIRLPKGSNTIIFDHENASGNLINPETGESFSSAEITGMLKDE